MEIFGCFSMYVKFVSFCALIQYFGKFLPKD